ncbi:MAG: terminase gpA endonuclease subunit, partial [Thermoguttaceae bacterium]
ESAFQAEYQNEPLIETEGDESMSAEEIAGKLNGYEHCMVPLDCQYVTTFIDVQQKALFYLTCAWERNFSGYVIDYGTFPDQQRPYFTLRDIHRTLAGTTKNAGIESTIYAGLESLCEKLLTEVYYREDGTAMRIDRCLIDANWGQSTDVVYQFCRQSKHAGVLLPSHGKYVGASSIPFSDYKRQRGDWIGHHCRIPNTRGKRQVRHVLIDTNYWKSFVHTRLAVLMGDGGCLSLFGRDAKTHQLLSEHIAAEFRVRTTAYGRTIDEWKLRASRPDNHWLDCLVGSAVAASICGAELGALQSVKKKRRERISFAELQRQRMAEREQNY